MRLLDKLFGKKAETTQGVEQAVLVQFAFGSSDVSGLFDLERQLEEILSTADLGEYDGNEVATDGSGGTLYMYGPDADALFEAVRQTLESTEFMKGARVQLRYGPPAPGVREREVVLGG